MKPFIYYITWKRSFVSLFPHVCHLFQYLILEQWEVIEPIYYNDIQTILNKQEFPPVKDKVGSVLPSSIDYRVHTRENRIPGRRVIDIHNPVELEDHKDRPILFITHGWRSSRDEKWVEKITNSALDSTDMIVIQVDWKDVAKMLYVNAASSVKQVGMHTY